MVPILANRTDTAEPAHQYAGSAGWVVEPAYQCAGSARTAT
jgi:hypothetical protein